MPNQPKQKINAVFEGGGVKGIGLAGAVAVTEAKGYEFINVAGTSAGAIVAALIAAGYTAKELKVILEKLDYNKFKDAGLLDKIPLLGPMLSLGFEKGIYEGAFFEGWIRDLLTKKGVRTFRDLAGAKSKGSPKYRLQVIATDISNGRMMVLPQDIEKYGTKPDNLDVARAVRMSMSIPFFFEPVILQDAKGASTYVVDGGVLSNYPVWIFDTDDPTLPTIGYKLVEPTEGKPNVIRGPISLFAALFSTMMEAHDARYIEDHDFARTVPIPTLGVQTTEFDLAPQKRDALYKSGVDAATEFFQHWDFPTFKERHLKAVRMGRRARVWGK
jgi:NTE family protein